MLKYPCLVLDHDDTVVQSELTVNFPHFLPTLDSFRPGATISAEEYADGCYRMGFANMCRQRFSFTEQEILEEYTGWKEYIKTHIPDPFPGIGDVIRKQKALGGKVCVVSHSCNENITRDYSRNFGILPDDIFGWDLPEELRKPSTWPLEQIMVKYSLAPNQLLVVDDMKPAWVMASKASVPIAFAAWSRKNFPEINAEMTRLCDYSFQTPEELGRFLFDGLTTMV